MAREVIFTDDLDGSHGATPVQFGLADKQYEIDLSEQHIAALKQALAPYLEHGREVVSAPPTGRRRGRSPRGTEPARREDLAAIRAWAKRQGYSVAPRGRIKAEIIEEYDREQTARIAAGDGPSAAATYSTAASLAPAFSDPDRDDVTR